MYNLGDKVVYPMHGAGTIESVEEKEILGQMKQYYVLKMPVGEIKLMIPVDNVKNIGIREIIDKSEVDSVIKVLEEDALVSESNWNKRYRENMSKMKTGDIHAVAQVVRDLAFRDKEKGLSTGEKKMLMNAKQMLVSEISLSTNSNADDVSDNLDKLLYK